MISYISFFSFIVLFNLMLFKYAKEIGVILLISIFIKLLLILINNNFFYLMDGNADAYNFHKHAVMYLDLGREAIFEGGLDDIYALSQISAYIYSLFGEDIMFMQLISLCVSSLSLVVFYFCLSEFKLKENYKFFSCLIFLFHPFLLNYSILTMREVYAVLLLLLFLLCILKYFNTKNSIYLFLSLIPIFPIYYVNGGLLITYFVLFFFITKPYLLKKQRNLIFQLFSIILLALSFIAFLYILAEFASVPYLRNMREFLTNFDTSVIISGQTYIQSNWESLAGYPSFLVSDGSIFDFIYKAVLRYFYFIFSPFPWDITDGRQLIGLMDPFIHIIFFIVIFRNFSKIIKNEKLIFLLVLYFVLTVTYSFGVGNFGQGIRHKAKFIPILMMLCSSFYFTTFKNLLSNFAFFHRFKK